VMKDIQTLKNWQKATKVETSVENPKYLMNSTLKAFWRKKQRKKGEKRKILLKNSET
jgi:hypothetical protein